MENILNYYYGFKDVDILILDNNYLILDKDDYSYYLAEYNENININNIINILNNLKQSNNYGKLVINNYKQYITKINNKNYILIRLKGIINEIVPLNEMVNNNISNRYSTIKNIDLVDLWSKKIDYLEYQVSELGNNHNEVLNSFSYFVGLAENAITFLNVNNVNLNEAHMSLQHLRVKNNELVLDYYNPLNVLIDFEIRDYAEYLKSKILVTDDILRDITYILDNANLNINDIKLFYARLMFPTLYFDKVEDILLNNVNEKELEVFLESINRYLDMLKDVYLEIKKKGISLDIPNWIIKS